MAQTETAGVERAEKTLDKTVHPELHRDVPVKTNQQVADEWDAAFNKPGAVNKYAQVSDDLKASALAAYTRGGSAGLAKLEEDVNKLVKAPGAGPIFIINSNKIEIHNIQGISQTDYSNLPVDQQAQYKDLISVLGGHEMSKELSPPLIFDKPDMQGLSLKPGQQVSSEFPSEYAIATAFKAGGMLNKDWLASNPEQAYLIRNLQPAAAELPTIPKGVLDGKASIGDVTPVNDFLKQHGFDMQLAKIGPGEVAMAATLSLKGDWAGDSTTMTGADGKTYPAAFVHGIKSFTHDGVTVAQLYQKDGITVYAALAGNDQMKSYQVAAMAAELTPPPNSPPGEYGAVLMPKIDKNLSADLTGLIGMSATDGTKIAQAKMQTKLQVDEKGFSAEQGVAFAASRGASPKALTLDKPFIVWAVADGCSQPLFATEVDQRYWKDPKRQKK